MMKALVVEDEVQIADVIRTGLETQRFVVDVCHDGQSGLEKALAAEPAHDLIILDIMLPSLDGVSVLRELRRNGRQTPVILLTARDAIEDRVEGLDQGADDYLTKPFFIDELTARIRAVMRRNEKKETDIAMVGNLSVNRRSREVFIGLNKVPLTTREYCLIELLVRTPGNVYTRPEILEKVWEMDFDPSTNIIEVYVRRLRSKFADAGDPDIIETVRGVGYRIAGVVKEPAP